MYALGEIEAIVRYPVKSMAGEPLERATLGWHGVDGDRRFAFRRVVEKGGMPWLTAGRLPELVRYQPLPNGDGLPTHVRTPDGRELAIDGAELRAEIAARHGAEVDLMRLNHGMFDEAPVSLIASETVRGIEWAADRPLDIRRFRPNVIVKTLERRPFAEDAWVGKVIRFGEADDAPAVAITLRDVRCAMLNIDPDTAETDPSVLKTVVRVNQNFAGVYATVVRGGVVSVGQMMYIEV